MFSLSGGEVVHCLVILVLNVEISVSRWLDQLVRVCGDRQRLLLFKFEISSERKSTPRVTPALAVGGGEEDEFVKRHLSIWHAGNPS